MQDLKVYIVIEDPKTRQDVSIKGNFEVLRAFLSGVGTLEIQELNTEPAGSFTSHSLADKPKTASTRR